MKEKVYFIKAENTKDVDLAKQIVDVIVKYDMLSFVQKRDMVAVKTHFGETEKVGVVRPVILKEIAGLIKKKGGLPFATETSALYKGNRSDAITHMEHANKMGYDINTIGMPIIMADGLYGDEETEIQIDGEEYKAVSIASLVSKIQSMVVVSHFTGHLAAGFGAALKNLGMGLSSRKGKLIQHSTAQPSIKKKKCTSCGVCLKWCPVDAITMGSECAVIDAKKCIGCGECLAMCRFDAVVYNWEVTYNDLQRKITEHAFGAVKACPGKMLFINVLTRISKDCDCMPDFEQIAPDIGVLISFDPVAIDAASLDLVEKALGKPFTESAYDIPYRIQIEHATKIKFGNADYELEEIS